MVIMVPSAAIVPAEVNVIVPPRSLPSIVTALIPVPAAFVGGVPFPIRDVTLGATKLGSVENTKLPVPVSPFTASIKLAEVIELVAFPYKTPDVGKVH